jgi:hypothetical protein
MGACWTFRAFRESDIGPNVIEQWFGTVREGVRTKFRNFVAHLAGTPVLGRPYFDKLEGYDNLYEVIVKAQMQQRILACYGPGERDVTLLIGAKKSGASKGKPATWFPKNARQIAYERSKLPLGERRYTDEYC